MIDQVASDATVIVGGAGGIIGVALMLRKMWTGTRLDEARQGGEHSIIKTLRDEVERLGNINKDMSDALSTLQLEIIKLSNQNIALVGEIGALRNENAQLTMEILKLNDQISKWDTKCAICKYRDASYDEENQ